MPSNMKKPSQRPADSERQLMIKVKTCERLIKEVDYYHKEVRENEQILQDMKDQGRDVYDIKKFQEVLDESVMMVPDSKRRMEQAFDDLELFVQTCEITDNEWYKKATLLLEHRMQSHDITCDKQIENFDDIESDEVF